MAVPRSHVKSGHMHSMGWDSSTGELDVEFKNGAVHRYHGVTEAEYEEVLRSRSRGSAFARLIRDRKPSTRIG